MTSKQSKAAHVRFGSTPHAVSMPTTRAFSSIINVRFGKADIPLDRYDVRFTPKSGHCRAQR
jgi:hypothetical protein